MATNILKTRIKHKINSPDKWNNLPTFKPLEGELIIYKNATEPLLKIGDGETSVVNLPFVGGKAITNISREGTTFTATHADGTFSTFTQQDNNTIYSVVTSSTDGIVPKFDTVDGTIDSELNDWVLTNNNGSIGWYKLPTNAFKNDNTTSFNITASANDDDVVILSGTNGTNKVTYSASHAKKGPSSGYTSNNTTTSISGAGSEGIIKIPQITVDSYGHITSASDESITIKIPTASDMGLSGAMKFLGISTTAIQDEATTNPITIGTANVTVSAGNVVLYGSKEFVWTGNKWEELGNEGSYKIQQNAVSSPSTSGSTTAFIDTISQNAQGVITATKKNVTFPTLSGGNAAGNDATVIGGVTVSGHTVTVGKKILTAGNNVTITGDVDKITIAATDTTYTTASQSLAGLMSASDKKKLDSIAAGATANIGDITGVIAGNGLTGGGTSGSVTLNIGAGAGLTVSADEIGHTNNITAGTVSDGGQSRTLTFNETFNIPSITYDTQGHIIEKNLTELTLPSDRLFTTLVPTGTSIPANADLNTVEYLKVGRYYCSKNDSAKTLLNCPTNVAFMMEVYSPLSTAIDNETTKQWVYRLRKITVHNSGLQFIQYCTAGDTAGVWTYNSWKVIPMSTFTLDAADSNGGSALIGNTVTPIYINQNGYFTACSKEIPIVYTANECTTFTSDSGTVTPAAVKKAVELFGVLNTGDVVSGDLTFSNPEATTQSNHPRLIWNAIGANTPRIGYASDQTDGTFIIASLKGTTYQSGLAIGGGSGNLLWKGSKVLTYSDMNTGEDSASIKYYVPTNAGTSGQLLKSNGNSSAPSWIDQGSITAGAVAWSGVTSKPSYYDAKAIKGITRSGTTFTYTCMDGTTGTFTQQDNNTTYSNATTSTAGLMSADDKVKLNGIATGANKYSLPTASSSTLGGVKIGTGIGISSGVISNSGVRSIATGSTNGTISVNTNGSTANVAVKGLGSAAYTNSTAYATASHNHDSVYVKLSEIALGQKHATVLTVGKHGAEYNTINAAITRAKQLINEYADGSRILIFIIDNNVYEEEITLLNNPGIDIAGLGAVVRSYVRHYPYGPLYTSGKGTFYGISFEAYNEIQGYDENNNECRPSYGFHCDYHNDNVATSDLRLINCRFIVRSPADETGECIKGLGTQSAGIGAGNITDITFENCFFRSLTHSALYVHNSPWGINGTILQQIRFFNCQFEGSYTTNDSDYKYASAIKVQDYANAVGGSQLLGLTFSSCEFLPVGSVIEDITGVTVTSEKVTINAKTTYVNGLVKTPGIQYFVQGNIYPNFIPFDYNDANTYQYMHITQSNQNGHATIPKLSPYPEMSELSIVNCYHNGSLVDASSISILNNTQKTAAVGTGLPNAILQFSVSLLPRGFRKI